MGSKLGYRWRLREIMAARGLYMTTDLSPLLAERGINLSAPAGVSAGHPDPRAPVAENADGALRCAGVHQCGFDRTGRGARQPGPPPGRRPGRQGRRCPPAATPPGRGVPPPAMNAAGSPTCSSCGRAGLSLRSGNKFGLGRVCSRCLESARAEPCSICTVVRPLRRRSPDGAAICGACVEHQLGEAKRAAKRQLVIEAVRRIEPELSVEVVAAAVDHACDITWRLTKVADALVANADCLIAATSDSPVEVDRLATLLPRRGGQPGRGFRMRPLRAAGCCQAVIGRGGDLRELQSAPPSGLHRLRAHRHGGRHLGGWRVCSSCYQRPWPPKASARAAVSAGGSTPATPAAGVCVRTARDCPLWRSAKAAAARIHLAQRALLRLQPLGPSR